MSEIEGYLKERKKEVDRYIERMLPEEGAGPLLLRKAMRYSLLAGGKRLRPILTLTSYEIFKGTNPDAIMPVAVALEYIHTFTLIHDDLPALDDDDLRRGKPTNHKMFGEAMAILAGDALFIESFNLLLKSTLKANILRRIMDILTTEIGTDGVIGGQVVDIVSERDTRCDEKTVKYIHERKTASFIRASIEIGGIAAEVPSSTMKILTEAGTKMGLAFQIVDDILDEISTPEELGKTPGKDRMSGKCTWVKIFGMEKSRQDAQKLIDDAVKLLDTIPGSDTLKDIAKFIVERKH